MHMNNAWHQDIVINRFRTQFGILDPRVTKTELMDEFLDVHGEFIIPYPQHGQKLGILFYYYPFFFSFFFFFFIFFFFIYIDELEDNAKRWMNEFHIADEEDYEEEYLDILSELTNDDTNGHVIAIGPDLDPSDASRQRLYLYDNGNAKRKIVNSIMDIARELLCVFKIKYFKLDGPGIIQPPRKTRKRSADNNN